jgi:hypothetical protein
MGVEKGNMKTPDQQPSARIYFTDFFDVSPDVNGG